MAIRFVCSCGQHLRAREKMAARRTLCPACGRPVGIPSHAPTQRGTQADPLSLTENYDPSRFRSSPTPAPLGQDVFRYRVVPLPDSETLEAAEDAPVGPASLGLGGPETPLERKLRRCRRPRCWQFETSWWECMAYPIRAWPLLAWLAAGLTLGIGFLLPAIPSTLDDAAVPWFLLAIVPLAVTMYLCGFAHCVLTSALAGEAGIVRWPGLNVVLVFQGFSRCLVCFLGGPAILLAVAFWFWLDAGDLTVVDGALVAELVFVAAGYWLFALVAVARGDSLGHCAPRSVLQLVRRLGITAPAALLVFAAAIVLHGAWIVTALAGIHSERLGPWLSLWCAFASYLFVITFLLRWLGVRSLLPRADVRRLGEADSLPLR